MDGMNKTSQANQNAYDEKQLMEQALNPTPNASDSTEPFMAKDPVCGVLVDTRNATNTLPSPVNETMGTIYFHSPECKSLFEQDPERYGSNF